MNTLLPARIASFVVLIGLAGCTEDRADTLVSTGSTRNGSVHRLSREHIEFVSGCGRGEVQSVPWGQVREVVFDTVCDDGTVRLPSAGGELCAGAVRDRFLLYFRGLATPVVADDLAYEKGGLVHFTDRWDLRMAHGPAADLQGVRFAPVCDTSDHQVAGPSTLPTTYCSEPLAFAAEFSFSSPLRNSILSNGIAFHLTIAEGGNPPSAEEQQRMRDVIRSAFGHALGLWLSEAYIRRDRITDPDVRRVIMGFARRGSAAVTLLPADGTPMAVASRPTAGEPGDAGGLILFTPPQVVSLQCPHNANFAIRVYLDKRDVFAEGNPKKVAYAQMPGRTLLLNMADYPCWVSTAGAPPLDAQTRCVNAVAVLAHEIGHAFGLTHASDGMSIMNDIIRTNVPGDQDIAAFIGALATSVEGGRPGQFTFTHDRGVAVE